MKAQWLMRALIAAVLGIAVVFIVRRTEWKEVTIPSPLRGEAVTNPFYAAEKLATELGATTERRRVLGTLDDATDVLVLTNWHWSLIEDRRRLIERWVENGGRLIVDNTLIGTQAFSEWSGVEWGYSSFDEEETEAPDVDTDVDTVSYAAAGTGSCDFLEEAVPADRSREYPRAFSVCKLDGYSFLEAGRDIAWGLVGVENERPLQVVRVDVGEGSVTVLNFSSFGNRDLTEADHGELFVAATQLRTGTRIAFLSETEHASLLALMWMYGAPVIVLLALSIALMLWRTGVRFGPLIPATDTGRRSLADQIRGTGRFAIRLGDGKALHAATVRGLREAAQQRIPRYAALSEADRIAAVAARSGIDAATLASAVNATVPRRTTELAHTIALLENARRRILE